MGKHVPDLVVLDIMLTGIDGFEVCRRIREVSAVPIIILTSDGTKEDIVKGLHAGADDCIAKPFSTQELLARVKALLRRAHLATRPEGQTIVKAGDLQIDILKGQVTVRGKEVAISPTEYRLLLSLAAHPDTVLTRDHLIEEVWGATYRGYHEILRVTLWRLRRKLEEDPSNPQYIITRPGIGYMLVTAS